MKQFVFLVLISFLTLTCDKSEAEGDPIPADLTVLTQGSFESAAHPTSGIVKLAKDAAGKKYLVFENFKSDPGPDLRIWLAEDKSAKVYTELSTTVPSGSFKIDVPASADTNNQIYVLIWCRAFTVLFGSARLN